VSSSFSRFCASDSASRAPSVAVYQD
jgi:hypothetical protein